MLLADLSVLAAWDLCVLPLDIAALARQNRRCQQENSTEKENPMTARTTIANLHPHMSHADVRDDLAAALGDEVGGYDVDGIVTDWLDAVTDALPEGWMAHANGDVTAPASARTGDDPRSVVSDAVETIDQGAFWAIAERHAK